MITIENLHKAFKKNQVLKGVDLTFDQGGITAVLGPNGSGKTTLIKSILGMVIPDQGNILINGESVKGKWKYREGIDYLPQIARFPENLFVQELFEMVQDLRSSEGNNQELIELFELQPFLDKRLGHLSGGTRQKVNIIQSLMFDSPIIILDEPTSGLDPVAMLHLKDLINMEKAKGKTILITTHIMSFVEDIADDVVFLLEGKIHFQGSLKKLKNQYNETTVERAIAAILQKDNTPNSLNGSTLYQSKPNPLLKIKS
ncbi:MAG: ABC transporter ATP-binding protein [Saprospiraceae bacterium]